MSEATLRSSGEASAAWLTSALSASGVGPGIVRSARRSPLASGTTSASVYALDLVWSADAAAHAPQRLILKIASPDAARAAYARRNRLHQRELAFYARAAPVTDAALPRCFASSGDGGDAFHLLLEDCSAAGRHRPQQSGFGLRDLERLADWLARFHGAWWGKANSVHGRSAPGNADHAPGEDLPARMEELLALAGDRVDADDRSVCRRAAGSSREIERSIAARPTLCHGDLHPLNVFFPEDGAPRVIDWQCSRVAPGLLDLSFVLAFVSHPRDRRRWQRGLVDRYWEALGGVREVYSRSTCWEDYRKAVVATLARPALLLAIPGIPAGFAVDRLSNVLDAFADVDGPSVLRAVCA